MEVAATFVLLLCGLHSVSLAADWEAADSTFSSYLEDAIDYKDPCKAGTVRLNLI